MARKESKTLTEGELRIMEVVWKLQNASVKDVTDVLQAKEAVAYNTVQTMLRILETKGYLTHVKSGRSFIYHPVVERKKARSAALKQLLASFFDDSPQSLVVGHSCVSIVSIFSLLHYRFVRLLHVHTGFSSL